jgi:hypothetical protein
MDAIRARWMQFAPKGRLPRADVPARAHRQYGGVRFRACGGMLEFVPNLFLLVGNGAYSLQTQLGAVMRWSFSNERSFSQQNREKIENVHISIEITESTALFIKSLRFSTAIETPVRIFTGIENRAFPF